MAAINDLVNQIENPELRLRIQQEVAKMGKQRKFGLVFEEHVPENTFLYDVPVRRGSLVAKRDGGAKETYRVISMNGGEAFCEHTVSHEQETIAVDALVSVAQLGEPIYPYLKPMGKVKNAPDSDLWHALIEADNYHALQLLVYLYAGQVDCIYIDPPYNKPDGHDWKYNCDYVDGNDNYRHSKWLSMMEKRLKIAKKLLNPNESVLIVTIDELEYNHLGCLLEQIFPEARIQMISSVINPGGVARNMQFSRTDEYLYILEFGNASPNKLSLNDEWAIKVDARTNRLSWRNMSRAGSNSTRLHSPGCFYPIFVSKDGKRIIEVGEALAPNDDRDSIEIPNGSVAIWPIHRDQTEGCWQLSPAKLRNSIDKGYVRLGRFSELGMAINYLNRKEIEKVEVNGIEIIGHREDGSIITDETNFNKKYIPGTQWRINAHNALIGGTNLIKSILPEREFSYPKSLYAVHDAIRFFVANKPNALILDFFAGSGTTLHAVNLLNAEDGGKRRCIMVTNNEIGETKERELKPLGIRPGDEEWEKWGIARYVNWPRTECSIKGIDVNGKPIEGEYITTKTETRQRSRRFSQINFLTNAPSLKQKKALVSFINKQKTIKLPTLTEDAAFLLAEDDDACNASILFDVTAIVDWKDALEGHDEITDFYVVTQKDALFRQVKAEVSELMGQIEEPVPITLPMKDGFKANAAYFKLGFLDKTSVALGRQFRELLPILWMKAGARGECPCLDVEELPKMLVFEDNHFAVLIDECAYPSFRQTINEARGIDVVYIVSDSVNGYKEMAHGLDVRTTYQLYRDYLDNFRINNVQ